MTDLRAGFADIFEVEIDEIRPETRLDDLAWDSLAMVSVIAMYDELFGKEIKIAQLKACRTIGDLEALAAA